MPLLRQLALLSRPKFELLTILESFNYGEAAEKARVRMVPEGDEERTTYLAKQIACEVDNIRVEVDLSEEGYRAILFWLDRLTGLYKTLEARYGRQVAQETHFEREKDLFSWSEAEAKRPQAFKDPFHHSVEQGLKVYYTTARQYRTARLILYLHLIERLVSGRVRFDRFPRIEAALQPRPRMPETQRKPPRESSQEQEWEAL